MDNFFLLATICLIAMVSPGPDFILVSRNSLLYPRLQAFATSLGIISGCIFHATYCILGLAIVITQSILVFSIIKYAGALYLIYLGIKGLTASATKNNQTELQSKQNISLRTAFMQGFLCNLLNPKLAVFLLSLFTQFITLDASLSQKITVAAVFVVESMLYWPLVVVAFQWKTVKEFFETFQSYIDKIFGGLMVALGIKVAIARD